MMDNRTLLIVDDEDFIRQIAREILELQGFRVLEAPNGRDAVSTYGRERADVDLVVLDLAMPIMNGKETLRRLKEMNKDVKVIMTTGYTDDGESEELLSMGACTIVEKPYRVEQLIHVIQSVLTEAV